MKQPYEIEQMIRDLRDPINAGVREAILGRLEGTFRQRHKSQSVPGRLLARRILMKNHITKTAVAAAVGAVVVLGLYQFINTGSTSGVVWAKVAQEVETNRTLIYRRRDPRADSEYAMNYLSAANWRTDAYEGEQISVSHFQDFEAMTGSSVFHKQKRYWRDAPLGQQSVQGHDKMTDPKWIVQSILSSEHSMLGRKMIDGVLCEGLETTDPAVFGDDSGVPAGSVDLCIRLWAGVETNLPVLCEGKIIVETDGNTRSSQWVLDEFQWDAEIDSDLFKVEVPASYEEM